ncbi:MAG: TraR/DksA family transcriptional regulator [Pseudomonadales bacterium]
MVDQNKLKDELVTLREELLGRLGRTHQHIHHKEGRVSANFSEQSVEMESEQLVHLLDEEGRHELRLIDRALARLEEGTYGECVQCGEPVGDGRLEAIPYAELCIACASAGEE